MVILGPSLHFWFNFVSKLFPRKDLFSTLKKMVMGQTLYGPAMTVVFFSLNARLQGMSNSLSLIFITQFPSVYGFALLSFFFLHLGRFDIMIL